MRAKIISMQIRNNQVAINLFAVVNGFFVEMINPEKNDCEIPIYNIGSMLTIKKYDIYCSNITKSQEYLGIFEAEVGLSKRKSFKILSD